MNCPKCGGNNMTVDHRSDDGNELNICLDCDTGFTTWQQTELAALRAQVESLKAEVEPMRKQIRDALTELPHVAGPLAHRIRMMREQYDGWCKEYKQERDALKAEVDRLRATLKRIATPNRCANPSQCAQEALDGDKEPDYGF